MLDLVLSEVIVDMGWKLYSGLLWHRVLVGRMVEKHRPCINLMLLLSCKYGIPYWCITVVSPAALC